MSLFLRKTGIHHLWLSNLTTVLLRIMHSRSADTWIIHKRYCQFTTDSIKTRISYFMHMQRYVMGVCDWSAYYFGIDVVRKNSLIWNACTLETKKNEWLCLGKSTNKTETSKRGQKKNYGYFGHGNTAQVTQGKVPGKGQEDGEQSIRQRAHDFKLPDRTSKLKKK